MHSVRRATSRGLRAGDAARARVLGAPARQDVEADPIPYPFLAKQKPEFKGK